ncbi:ribosomal protein s17 domain-containing protein [Sarocladium implicatum]|nr:ribosomal protein s17 domain-containing protein [Sarocladium implicatum]
MSSQVATAARRVNRDIRGVVVSAGLMDKTVKVRVGAQKWNKIINKHFAEPKHYLVHDPNTSLRTGDVVSIMPGWPTSQHKRHLVKKIIAPYGVPIEERPPIPTLEELITVREAKKEAKDERRASRRQEAEEKRKETAHKLQERKEAKRLVQGSHRTEPKKSLVEGDN